MCAVVGDHVVDVGVQRLPPGVDRRGIVAAFQLKA
ncbi:MAG: hypothetical protein JWR32_866 [Mycobacterium sp.]|jgi:hypothetical protein|nr:hypothetical protein [Mycobacterium sp.]